MVSYTVDYWSSSLHDEEIGVRQREVLMSQSRQFTKDMDLFGDLKKDRNKFGVIGYRKSIWDEEELKKGGQSTFDQRLVVKAFSQSESGNISWWGTIEELVGKSIAKSFGTGEPLPVFAVILDVDKLVHTVEKIYRGPLRTDTYALSIYNENAGTFEAYKIIGERVSLGADYKVFSAEKNKHVVTINSKLLNVGGKCDIEIKDPNLSGNDEFIRTLILFVSTLKFQGEVENRISKTLSEMEKGKLKIKADTEELGLMRNPRYLKSTIT
ncbi:MAG: hypothetical protein KIH08_14080 [Candidatus Freyarchaeota archaeon]|nr:hypothetical protein [Candidatus Jordarchaeia archaeon]MBS7268614.1 hypothetical protein [Candidatus Jordarchaeia archaeon]MBS7278756.1 hypothetical protein [Candidatus Jordarchaeia archaeon]